MLYAIAVLLVFAVVLLFAGISLLPKVDKPEQNGQSSKVIYIPVKGWGGKPSRGDENDWAKEDFGN